MAEPCQRQTQSFCIPSDPLALRKPGNRLPNCFRASWSEGEAVPDVIGEALNVDHVGHSTKGSSVGITTERLVAPDAFATGVELEGGCRKPCLVWSADLLLPREAFVDFNEDNPSLSDFLEVVAPWQAFNPCPTRATDEPKTWRSAIRIFEMGFDEVIATAAFSGLFRD